MLGHLSLARPITCLISRWPNSPPESSGIVLRIVVARLYLDAGAQKMFTIWFWLRVSLARLSSLLFFACHTMAAKLKMFASHVCVWLRFIFHVGHSIVFDTTHATRWHTHSRGPQRGRARDSTQSVLCQITNKYHAWPKAAIKAINWQRATGNSGQMPMRR